MLGKINRRLIMLRGLPFTNDRWLVTQTLNFFVLLGSCWLGLWLLGVLLVFWVHPLDLVLGSDFRCTYCMYVK
jgi:hypothetical protein